MFQVLLARLFHGGERFFLLGWVGGYPVRINCSIHISSQYLYSKTHLSFLKMYSTHKPLNWFRISSYTKFQFPSSEPFGVASSPKASVKGPGQNLQGSPGTIVILIMMITMVLIVIILRIRVFIIIIIIITTTTTIIISGRNGQKQKDTCLKFETTFMMKNWTSRPIETSNGFVSSYPNWCAGCNLTFIPITLW